MPRNKALSGMHERASAYANTKASGSVMPVTASDTHTLFHTGNDRLPYPGQTTDFTASTASHATAAAGSRRFPTASHIPTSPSQRTTS